MRQTSLPIQKKNKNNIEFLKIRRALRATPHYPYRKNTKNTIEFLKIRRALSANPHYPYKKKTPKIT